MLNLHQSWVQDCQLPFKEFDSSFAKTSSRLSAITRLLVHSASPSYIFVLLRLLYHFTLYRWYIFLKSYTKFFFMRNHNSGICRSQNLYILLFCLGVSVSRAVNSLICFCIQGFDTFAIEFSTKGNRLYGNVCTIMIETVSYFLLN